MTTDDLPQVNEVDSNQNNTGSATPAEQIIKDVSIESESRTGRKLKFIPESRSAKVSILAASGVGAILILLILVMLIGGGKNNNPTNQSSPVVVKDLDPNNNSDGYTQSNPANFGQFSLDLNYDQPVMIKSNNFEGKVGDQISWPDGFAILVATVDRDYRLASEYDYKKITEAGDELVRVNVLVGNATNANMKIGYSDLQIYAENTQIGKVEPERISEDTYSPVEGQILGGKQTKKISLHYRVKRGQSFYITKTKTFTQNNAKVKNGEEKKPVLTLKINL